MRIIFCKKVLGSVNNRFILKLNLFLFSLIFFLTNNNEVLAQENSIFSNCFSHLHNDRKDSLRKDEEAMLFNFQFVIPPQSIGRDTILEFPQTGQATLFIAYATQSPIENNLIKLSSELEVVEFLNTSIKKENINLYEHVNAQNGVIVSYELSSSDLKAKRYVSIKDYVDLGKNSGNQLLELILFPFVLDEISRNEIETYLSIKYGISLACGTNYITSSHKIIWDGINEKEFCNRVTGLGRDDNSGLFQKQSHNSTDQGLIIGLDSIKETNFGNNGHLEGLTYLIWGDNNGSEGCTFDSITRLNTASRIWKVKAFSDNLGIVNSYQVIVNPIFMSGNDVDSLKGKGHYWMVIYDSIMDFTHARFLKGIKHGDSVKFDNVSFCTMKNDTLDSSYFTFINAPAFAAAINLDKSACKCPNQKNVAIKILGGIAPFTINMSGDGVNNRITTMNSFALIPNQNPGFYLVSISDSSNQTYQSTLTINEIDDHLVDLPSIVTMDNNNLAELIPVFVNGDESSLKSEWFFNSQLVSNQTHFTAVDPGEYTLVITDSLGCTKQLKTLVTEQNQIRFLLHPNPVRTGEIFNIQCFMTKETTLDIEITDAIGKITERLVVQAASGTTISNRLFSPGVYFLRIRTTTKSYTLKLIVI